MTQQSKSKSEQSRYSVSDEAKPIALLSTPLYTTLIIWLTVVIAGCMWAIFARIPLTVNGSGVLLPVGSVSTRLTASYGTAFWMFHRPYAAWEKLAWQFRNNPDTLSDQQVESLARSITVDLSSEKLFERSQKNSSASALSAESLRQLYRSQPIPAGKLMLFVHSSLQIEQLISSIEKLRRANADAFAQAQNIRSKQRMIEEELKTKTTYLKDMQSLSSQGYVSKTTILQQRTEIDGLRSQLIDTKNSIIAYDLQISSGYQNLRDALAQLIAQTMIFNMGPSYLSQIVPNDGETVMQGQPVIQLSQDPLTSPVYVPVFLANQDMAQVFSGMKILATPAGYRRAEVGGIRGKVVSIARLPSDLDDVTALVGARPLAEEIVREQGAPSLAIVALERSKKSQQDNSGGYVWSSQSPLPFPPKAGDRLSVEITTTLVSPMSLVIPTLKKFFGITPPERPAKENVQDIVGK